MMRTCTPCQSFSRLLYGIESSTSFSGQKLDGRDSNGYPFHPKYLKFLGKNSRPFGRYTELILSNSPLGDWKASNLRFGIFLNALELKFIYEI